MSAIPAYAGIQRQPSSRCSIVSACRRARRRSRVESLDRLMERNPRPRAAALDHPRRSTRVPSAPRSAADPAASHGARHRISRIALEDGSTLSGSTPGADARRNTLPNGREIDERHFDLPALPIGRHWLDRRRRVERTHRSRRRRPTGAEALNGTLRFGVSSQLYAPAPQAKATRGSATSPRLGLAATAAATRRRRLFRRQPDAHAVSAPARAGKPVSPFRPALSRSRF